MTRPDHDTAARIRSAEFSTVRAADAYDLGQVDYLLDRLEAAALAGRSLGPLLDGVELNQVRLREGYDIAEVDAFLASLRVTATPEAIAVAAAPEPAPEPAHEPTLPAAPAQKNRRGFWSRLFRN